MTLDDKIRNLVSKVKGGAFASFSEFLTLEEQAQCTYNLRECGFEYGMFGGYDDADRKILAVSESDDIREDMYPIDTIQIHCGQNISHSDILGSVLSLKIRREVIGDILVLSNGYFLYADKKIAPYICINLERIKNYRVKAEIYSGPKLISNKKFETKKIIVSSLRLDCIAGALNNLSRGKVSELILSQRVLINHEICTKRERIIREGDIITIRRAGKFVIRQISGLTKKQRLILEIDKYV